MLKLNRVTPVFSTPWFLASALVASFLLGTALMAATDTSNHYQMQPWTVSDSWTYNTGMVMVVRAPATVEPLLVKP